MKNRKLYTIPLFKKANEHFFKNAEKYKAIEVYFPLTDDRVELYGDVVFDYSKRFRNFNNDLEFTNIIDDLCTLINGTDVVLYSNISIDIKSNLENYSELFRVDEYIKGNKDEK